MRYLSFQREKSSEHNKEKMSRDWSGNVQQVYNNFTIMGALNLDFIEILILLSSSVQLDTRSNLQQDHHFNA